MTTQPHRIFPRRSPMSADSSNGTPGVLQNDYQPELASRRISVKDIDVVRDFAVSPYGSQAEEWMSRYAREVGVIDQIGQRRFDAYNGIAKYVYSYASLDRLVASSSWLNFLFLIDDQFDENPELGRDRARVRRLIVAILDLLEDGTPIPDHPVLTRVTHDLRDSFARLASPTWMEQLFASTEDYLLRGVANGMRAWRWRRGNHHSLDSYMSMRDMDSGVYTCIDVVELAAGVDLPQPLRDDKRIQALRQLCARHVAFVNDIMSYDKEIRAHDNPPNLLHLLMTSEHLSFNEAAAQAVDIVNRDLQDFLRIETALSGWGTHKDVLDPYINGMHQWMRGNIDWSLKSQRYSTPNNPLPELRDSKE